MRACAVLPYSWLHMNDNIMDPFHVHVLHSTISGIQFHDQFALMPKVDFFHADHGVCYSAIASARATGGKWIAFHRG